MAQQEEASRQEQLDAANPFNEQEDRTVSPKPVEVDQIMDSLLGFQDNIDRMPEDFQPLPTDVGGTADVIERMMNQQTRVTDEVMFMLRRHDERGHARILMNATRLESYNLDEVQLALNPPSQFLQEMGMNEQQWQDALNRQVKQMALSEGLTLPPNATLRDNLKHMLENSGVPEAQKERIGQLLDKGASPGSAYNPEEKARQLLTLTYDRDMTPEQREAMLNSALSRLPDGVRRNEVRAELRELREQIECDVYDIDAALSKTPPDAADIQYVLRGQSPEDIKLISMRFAQATGYTGKPQEKALEDALALLDNDTKAGPRTEILSRFNADTQRDWGAAGLGAGGLAKDSTISAHDREILVEGYNADKIAHEIQVELENIRDEHGIGNNLVDFLTFDWSEDGATYQRLQRLMLGLDRNQIEEVEQKFGAKNLGDVIGPHAQNIDGLNPEAGRYASQGTDIDDAEMGQRADDVLATLTEREGADDDLTEEQEKEKADEARRLIRDAFAGLSEEQAETLRGLVEKKRIDSLSVEQEMKDSEGKPVLDEDGKPKMEKVVNADGKSTQFLGMMRDRLETDPRTNELLDTVTRDMTRGFSAGQTANALLNALRTPPVQSAQERNERSQKILRGLTQAQVDAVNAEYKQLLEQKMSMHMEITENVYSPFAQGFTEILRNGSPERPGAESLPPDWEVVDPIETVNRIDAKLNEPGVPYDQRGQNALEIIEGLSDQELRMLGPVANTFQRGVIRQLVTEANSRLEPTDREIVRDSLQMGFNPWTRTERLKDAVELLATDEAAGLAKIRKELQEAQEGVDAAAGAERIELMRRVYRRETGHELEDDLTAVEDDLTDAEDDLLERTRPDAEPVAPPEPDAERRPEPAADRVRPVAGAPEHVVDFVAKYEEAAAIAEAQTGVPAEVLIAEAARISDWGRRTIVDDSNPFHVQAPSGYRGASEPGFIHEDNTVLRPMVIYSDIGTAFTHYAENLKYFGPADLRDTDFSDDAETFAEKFVEPRSNQVVADHSPYPAADKIKTFYDNLELLTK